MKALTSPSKVKTVPVASPKLTPNATSKVSASHALIASWSAEVSPWRSRDVE